MSRTVLVTGFEPFGGETLNASWEAARAIDGWRCGEMVAVAVRLSCVYDACVTEFVEAFERLRPEAVLMTGQAARRAVASVESVARDRSSAAAPDNRGVVCAPSASYGPAEIETTARARAVARAIREAGLAARVSTDAGRYVCNHLYYGALNFLRDRTPGTPAVFVHLPAMPEQNSRNANRRRLATADAALALQAAITTMTGRCERRARRGPGLTPAPGRERLTDRSRNPGKKSRYAAKALGEAMTIATHPQGLSDVAAGRLDEATIKANFADLHPPLTPHEAKVEAERCYFCFDPPCQKACPTSIDIPLFIRQIAAGNRDGAARTIFDANIMGGMCARVCPTETLCEEACVREAAEGKSVSIGLLQRYATDALIEAGKSPYSRGAPTGKRVAVVGAGPAGLSCAHALAVAGVETTIFEARGKPGGLNEYGIAAYKTVDDFAAKEAAFIVSIGGIEVQYGVALGRDAKLEELRRDYDAVFLAMGLGSTNKLGLPKEGELENVVDAVDYIARLRQAKDPATLPVGRRVVVIGGGMTAIDIAVQSKRLGAQNVTIVYRRGAEKMKASRFERELAQTSGVVIRNWARPVSLEGHAGVLSGVVFEDTHEHEGVLASPGSVFRIEADMLFTAIGQRGAPEALDGAPIDLIDGRIVVDAERRTTLKGVWAGGDCVLGGEDLTVRAVEDGKQAARSIVAALGVGGA